MDRCLDVCTTNDITARICRDQARGAPLSTDGTTSSTFNEAHSIQQEQNTTSVTLRANRFTVFGCLLIRVSGTIYGTQILANYSIQLTLLIFCVTSSYLKY
jgi:hypothetical protein